MTEQTEGSGPSELELLKDRARLLGIEFSNNIGLETLRERVKAKLGEDEDQTDIHLEGGDAPDLNDDSDLEEEDLGEENVQPNGFLAAAEIAEAKITTPEIKPIEPVLIKDVDPSASNNKAGQAIRNPKGKTPSLRQHLLNEQTKLVRVRIQNLDPKKSDLNGEFIAVSNKYLGVIKMFVPYGEVTDDGWHIPYIIYKELNRRRFLSIRTVKDARTKQTVVKKGWAKEFAIDILPPLTSTELAQLATAQLAAGSIESTESNLL